MVRAEFVDSKGFKLMRVLESEFAPPYYSFAMLPPISPENWFASGPSGDAEIRVDHLLFHLKRTVDGIARYEEMR